MMDIKDLFNVQDRSVIVTGGGSGLGAIMCEALSVNGAHVYALDQNKNALNDLTKRCKVTPFVADTRDYEQLENCVNHIVAEHGKLDCAIANAGISDRGAKPLHLSDPADLEHVIDVNLGGTLALARACLGHMSQQGFGKFIAVASMWGHAAPAGLFPRPGYAASKGAIVNLVRELAMEYAKSNIQVNALCPGFFRTETRPRDAEHAQIMQEYTPLGRIADASEIAGSILYLASSASDFMTGSSLVIDGGVLAR